MKLGIDYQQFTEVIQGEFLTPQVSGVVDSVFYDTRKLSSTKNNTFFALTGASRSGHDFIQTAYNLGVRSFVISAPIEIEQFPNAAFFKVDDVLDALCKLARYNRNKFSFPIIAISGRAGKTTVKEWLYHLLSPELKIVRSPKSYNSQLGVALSLLELKEGVDVGIVEVKPHPTIDPHFLNQMIQPTHAIWTGTQEQLYHYQNAHYASRLFEGAKLVVFGVGEMNQFTLQGGKVISAPIVDVQKFINPINQSGINNASIAYCVAQEFLDDRSLLYAKLGTLPQLAMRMETFDGLNDNLLILDVYNLDLDALEQSLEYQKIIANGRKRAVIFGLEEKNRSLEPALRAVVEKFNPEELHFIYDDKEFEMTFSNSVVLIKGTHKETIQRIARRARKQNHKTHVQIDLKALRNNISEHRSLLPKNVKMMAMVKAASYGSGLSKMAQFLEQYGINYFGVAYADEAFEIRDAGVDTPVMVMNPEVESFESCIRNKIEPAIYSFDQLDAFISECIYCDVQQFPIHIKFDTGMARLGFLPEDAQRLIEVIQAQPEVKIKSIYSHLADADNQTDKRFTEHQIESFTNIIRQFENELNYSFETHLLNSAGIANYKDSPFTMVRLGIGMYGITSNPELKRKLHPVLGWYSSVSQIRVIQPGQSVGYSRSFIGDKSMEIATIPVGYADGYRRSLSNGKGGVFIHNRFCPTVGNVCMDMIMVDITGLEVNIGDVVEIIGPNNTLEKMAEAQGTIPYEVMTSISKRVHKIYYE